jgi:2-amino-4-hydroxy-6-hydroxymethyldihydropteridine diphosphokinase
MPERLVFVGLGSNLGDRQGHLDRARRALEDHGLKLILRSSAYRTEPVEVVDQEEFINQVVGCKTNLSPEQILEVCLAVERSMGRIRTRDKGPRVIDLDILLSGDDIRSDDVLKVPHPRMHLRRFVLVPLAEISPGAWHPVLKRTAAELLSTCPDRSRVERVLL